MVKINKGKRNRLYFKFNENGINNYSKGFIFEFISNTDESIKRVWLQDLSSYPIVANVFMLDENSLNIPEGEHTLKIYHSPEETTDTAGTLVIHTDFVKVFGAYNNDIIVGECFEKPLREYSVEELLEGLTNVQIAALQKDLDKLSILELQTGLTNSQIMGLQIYKPLSDFSIPELQNGLSPEQMAGVQLYKDLPEYTTAELEEGLTALQIAELQLYKDLEEYTPEELEEGLTNFQKDSLQRYKALDQYTIQELEEGLTQLQKDALQLFQDPSSYSVEELEGMLKPEQIEGLQLYKALGAYTVPELLDGLTETQIDGLQLYKPLDEYSNQELAEGLTQAQINSLQVPLSEYTVQELEAGLTQGQKDALQLYKALTAYSIEELENGLTPEQIAGLQIAQELDQYTVEQLLAGLTPEQLEGLQQHKALEDYTAQELENGLTTAQKDALQYALSTYTVQELLDGLTTLQIEGLQLYKPLDEYTVQELSSGLTSSQKEGLQVPLSEYSIEDLEIGLSNSQKIGLLQDFSILFLLENLTTEQLDGLQYPEEIPRGTVTNITYSSAYGSGQNFGYKQYVPADYDGNTATPLVIWLHGLGERSQSNGNPQFSRLELYGPFKEYKDFEADYPFLMIAPQQPTDVNGKYTGRGSWDVEVIEESLNHFKAQGYNIDLDRVYITGQSMGGGGVLSYINSAYGNDTIAAALPIATTLPQGTGIACNIKHIPIWIFHAENDTNGGTPSSNSKNLYNAIKACIPAPDVAPKITLFDLSGHTGWNQVYRNTGAAITDYADNSPFPNGTTWEDWLLQYTLQAVEPEPETAPEQVTGLTATATAHNNINLTWNAPNDGGSPIIGYRIERRTASGSFNDLVANTGNPSTVYSDSSVNAETQYYYRVSAINAIGTGLASTSANATTPEIPDFGNLIKINLGGRVSSNHIDPVLEGVDSTWFTIWHNIYADGPADYILKNANNENTPYTLTASNEDGGIGWGVVANNSTGDVGAITGDNSGVVPDNVSRFYWFTNSASKPNGGIIRINNLPNGSKWNVKIFASRDGSDGRQSAATIGGIKKTVVAAGNTSNWIEFEEVTISNNTIEILIKGEGQNFGYANAIILELLEEGSGPEKPTITVTATAPNENTIEIN